MKACSITIFLAQLFAIFLIVVGSEGNKGTVRCHEDCGPHEKWNKCGIASGCVRTCDNRNIRFKCISECFPGCYCEENYIRKHKDGPCILEKNCPPLK